MHRSYVIEPQAAKDKIILALDVPSRSDALRLVDQLGGEVRWFKIGLQLFCAEGPAFVRELRGAGANVFLDLKLHDIPQTVRHAVQTVIGMGVQMLTIHLLGGTEMCMAAVTGRSTADALLLGVTVLTSLTDDDLRETGFRTVVEDEVLLLGNLAKSAGIPGLVASPKEVAVLRKHYGSYFTIVTPGVRPVWAEPGDQKRFVTPAEAIQAGADYLVIGRPIHGASKPIEALRRVIEEVEAADAV
ncbi:MAG TPA: orotidine-5'-phosphate decarboxylase [Chthoniobacterales bacterium]